MKDSDLIDRATAMRVSIAMRVDPKVIWGTSKTMSKPSKSWASLENRVCFMVRKVFYLLRLTS